MKAYILLNRRRFVMVAVCVVLLFAGTTPTHAAGYSFQKITGGIKYPTGIAFPPGANNLLFVTDLLGTIRIVQKGQLVQQPFLDISTLVNTKIYGEGLYDMTFDPNYAHNRFFYIDYIDLKGNMVVARYSTALDTLERADPASAKILLTIPHPHGFHYGGQLAFGPDGYLYYSTGDSGSALDTDGDSQNKQSLLGAILRLDVHHGDPYSIPADNPYAHDSTARPELWVKGLRNPWRFSFDSLTGDLYIPDVGEDVYEEINFQPAGDKGGENYGWNHYEGTHDVFGGSKTGLTFPVMEYAHIDKNCDITGGYVYRGTNIPALIGDFIFADYCSGKVWKLGQNKGVWAMAQLAQVDMNITTFGQDSAGELYIGDFKTNAIYKLTMTP